jgi:hypothetical protein
MANINMMIKSVERLEETWHHITNMKMNLSLTKCDLFSTNYVVRAQVAPYVVL